MKDIFKIVLLYCVIFQLLYNENKISQVVCKMKVKLFFCFSKDVIDGLDLDVQQLDIVSTCTWKDSYFAGKDIAFAARAATISRAFNTTHHQTFDTAVVNCLNKWLRIDGNSHQFILSPVVVV